MTRGGNRLFQAEDGIRDSGVTGVQTCALPIVNKMIQERNIGGVLLFGYNMKSEAQTKALTNSLQELSMRTEPSIPLFIAVDQEGGAVSHAPWVAQQPAAARVGARGDPAEARAIAEEMGRELLRVGE